MKKMHKVVNFYGTESRAGTINNIHYFLYSKLIWEPFIVSCLIKHGKKAMLGSDETDVSSYDIYIENKNGFQYGCDVKITVTTTPAGINISDTRKFIPCISVNDSFLNSIYSDAAKNTFILYIERGIMYGIQKSLLTSIPSFKEKRGDRVLNNFLLDDLIPKSVEMFRLTQFEMEDCKEYQKMIKSTYRHKVPFNYTTMTEQQAEEFCNKIASELGILDKFTLHYNFGVSKF